MKKILLALSVLVVLASCGVNRQTREIKALGKCKYDLKSIDSIYVAGVALNRIINQNTIDLSSAPSIALGLLRQNIPFEGRVNLEIDNPTANRAAINQFEYIVLLQQKQLAEGVVNQKVSIEAGQTTVVPVTLKANVYELLTNGQLDQTLRALKSDKDDAGLLTIKIKPVIYVGSTAIKYPGYITIDKKISRSILL